SPATAYTRPIFADLDGDGLPEIIRRQDSLTTGHAVFIAYRFSSAGLGPIVTLGEHGAGAFDLPRYAGAFLGSPGKQALAGGEIVSFTPDSTAVFTNVFMPGGPLLVLDANGDGLADLIHQVPSAQGAPPSARPDFADLYLNTGNGFRPVVSVNTEIFTARTNVFGTPRAYDFNQDGRDDFMVLWPTAPAAEGASSFGVPAIVYVVDANGQFG